MIDRASRVALLARLTDDAVSRARRATVVDAPLLLAMGRLAEAAIELIEAAREGGAS